MHGLKSAILAIFQKSADWLDWPCPVSAALKNRPHDLFSLFYILIFISFLNMKPSAVCSTLRHKACFVLCLLPVDMLSNVSIFPE